MNLFDYVLFNGIGGVPYATFGMVGLVVGVFTYATIVDFVVDSEPILEKTEVTAENPISMATEKVSSLLGLESENPKPSPSLLSANEPGEQYKIMGGKKTKRHKKRSTRSTHRKKH